MHGAPSVWLAEAGPQPRCVRALACCPAGLNACLEVRSQQSTGLHCHSKPLPLGGPGLFPGNVRSLEGLIAVRRSGGLPRRGRCWGSGGVMGNLLVSSNLAASLETLHRATRPTGPVPFSTQGGQAWQT